MNMVNPQPSSDAPDKAVLFCPDCGHHSRYDEEWHVVDARAATRYLCPFCDTEITVRPRFDSTPSLTARSCRSLRETVDANVRLWQSVWRRSMRLCVPG